MSTPSTPATTTEAKPTPGKGWRSWLWPLLCGLPAVLIAVVMVAVVARQSRSTRLIEVYRADGMKRVQEQDYRGALIDFRRLVKLVPENQEYRLLLAVVLDRLKEGDRAEALARTLAPLNDQQGYLPAHLWLGQRMAIDNRGSRQRLKEAEDHLRKVLTAQPRNDSVKILLGSLLSSTGRPRDARPYLEAAADGKPDVLLSLAQVCRVLGDEEAAKKRIDQALDILALAKVSRPDDMGIISLQVRAMIAQGNYDEAIKLISQRKAKDEKEEQAKKLESAAVCLIWAQRLAEGKDPSRPDVLAALERGLSYDPANPMLLAHLGEVLKGKGEPAEKARAYFDKMIANQQFAAMAYAALGNEAYVRNLKTKARDLWEKSVAEKEFVPLAANNLAWSLANDEPKNPERALILIDKVVGAVPNDPRFRGTRGQVLLALRRYKDAQAELEKAEDLGEVTEGITKSLAEVYDKLDLKDKARQQRAKFGDASRPAGEESSGVKKTP